VRESYLGSGTDIGKRLCSQSEAIEAVDISYWQFGNDGIHYSV
jgi:hypothetical protein